MAGDLVQTRDHGPQPLRWIGRMRLTPADLRARPQHRLLLSGWRAELPFGEVELLVPALALVGDRAEQLADLPDGMTYLHLLFDRHEIIFAEGAEVESLLPDWLTRTDLPPALKAELADLLAGRTTADAAQSAGAARGCLTVREGRLLL